MVLLVFTGLFFMLLPDTREPEPVAVPVVETGKPDLEERLEEILSRISGVGKAEVLLTEALGADTVFQTDEDVDTGSSRQDTVIVSGSSREEKGLVRQVNPPVYLGAVVVCQGADSAGIRLAVVDAVRSVTGLSTDRISVMKMK